MYMTVEETADFLSMPLDQVKRYIAEKKIRAVFDGEQYVVNSAQFETHLEQVEELKRQIDEWRNTPIPEDIDVKDED
ncbi:MULTISPECIES: excisionase family DNA-binding protein [Psychrobacillus]|uniref:Excisionase family DNA-binding protein n=1 Tax=Psychrobacillus faecigallinarum TaxID=2762235 RepID=A0ABR8RAF5_9BACI|nr:MULTISPECIES: excisionase family DNA-binding protein [Psychrobacillus]MBD7944769.1 excisionase family DNA-binding protein [Psychrobacillus faecigallinarum]QEY21226.1 helix-turn-helix domain-containing protein [Psychrobacillus sp. AK 1817]QGM31742.1 excisionase family DNA-binding protein [Bacillus sp. N3536]